MSEYGNLIEGAFAAGPERAVGEIEADPEKAARSLELSQATGTPASAIYGDVESFERQHKSQMAGDIVRNNAFISDYVTQNQMAARLSNDDYGSLDAVSQSTQKLGKRSIMDAAIEGFKRGFGEDNVGGWMVKDAQDLELLRNNRMSYAVMSVLGAPIELFFRTAGAVVHGVSEGAGEAMGQATGSKAGGERLTRDLIKMADVAMPEFVRGVGAPSHRAFNQNLKRTIDAARPYIEAGREPPIGVDSAIDQLKIEQSKLDLDNLNEALKEAQASRTRERSPEIFASFIRQHTDASIGISADALQKLYGDKIPDVTDSKLGWVPDIAKQYETALATGGDVQIPMADWLARVDPELAKELKDDIRVRPGGVTKNEVEGLKARKAEDRLPPMDEVDSVREHAAVAFAFGEEAKRLKLEKMAEQELQSAGIGGAKSQFFKMVDEAGKDSGYIELTEAEGGKHLNIEMWAKRHTIGPVSYRVMRDVFRQLKEQFPNAETVGGFRATGARAADGKEGAKTKIAFAAIDEAEIRKLTDYLNSHRKPDIRKEEGFNVEIRPKEKWTAKEKELEEAVYEVLNRIVPRSADVEVVAGITTDAGQRFSGMHEMKQSGLTKIFVALSDPDVTGIARHEAIHHLYRQRFFNLWEWQALQDAALQHNWIEHYKIKDHYGHESFEVQLEEAVAEAYRNWAKDPASVPREIHPVMQKLKDLLDKIQEAIKGVLGEKLTFDEVFERVERGEVGSRLEAGPIFEGYQGKAYAKGDEPELPGMTRMEDREAFERASAIGMTVDQYKRYMKLIERRQAEDLAAIETRAEKEQKRRLTTEWKDAERDLRPQIVQEINNRPDVAADNFFREGLLYGNKVETTRLSSEHLTPEQTEALPKSYVRVNGIHPDDAASLFGYPNGAALVDSLIGINEQRKTYGGRPEEFKRHLVKMELERQMQAKYGDLERNIIEEAKDQVLSETQLDLLHEEVMALGLKAGTEYSITKEQLRGWVGEQFNQTQMDHISSDKFLATAGKAGRAVEEALLKGHNEGTGGDFATAFKEKQRQYIAITMATEAKKIEKAKAQLDRMAKTFAKREVPAVEQDYTNYIQGLLQQAGYPIRLTPDEIRANIDASGYAAMPDFIAEKQSFGWEPAVSEDIQYNGVKPVEQMTATEFRDFKDAIDSLNYIGRQERKIEVLGQKLDWEEYRKEVIDNVSQLPVRPRESQGRWLYEVDASLTRMEEMVKDLDLRQELGPIFNAVIEPMMASKAKSFDLLTDLSKFFKETKGEFGKPWRKSLGDTIPQDFLIDPYYRQPYDLTRENLIQIMLNWGNKSNIDKFARGHASAELGRIATKEETAAFAEKVKALIDQHATKEDWDFVQRMWEPFKKFQPMTDQVARNTSGVVPKWIQPEAVQTPHGTFDGGYWPVKYDRLGSDLNVIEDRKGSGDQLFGPSYFRAATAKGHLKERTGYVDFVDITTSIEQAAGVMQQTIHDIAYRDALMQASKVFYDKPIRAAIRKHYGTEYEAQLIPWLKRIANQYSVDERPIKGYNDWLRRARVNLIGHALPLNLKVILSPDIGTLNPASWARFESNRSFNTELAITKSNEIRHLVYNMDRDFREQLEQIVTKQSYSSVQTEAVRWGFKPMMKFSQEFRMATFVDQYNKAKSRGKNDHEASVIADSYVRERHGAASVVDLPAFMSGSESLKTLTMFYGFFNTMYNWQRQLPGNLRRGEYKDFMINGTGSVIVGAAFGAALFNQSKEGDSWFKTIAKALALMPLSTVPVVRDIANFFAEGYQSRSPISSAASAFYDLGKDIVRFMEKKPVKKPIQHGANVVGLATGMPMMQIGKTSQFAADVAQRKQQPRNILEWWRGIVTGEAKLKK